MMPWPKPATWPLIPPDSSAEVMEKEKVIIFQLCFALVSNYASCCMKSQICLLFYLVAPYPSQLIHTNFVFLSVYKFFSFDCAIPCYSLPYQNRSSMYGLDPLYSSVCIFTHMQTLLHQGSQMKENITVCLIKKEKESGYLGYW